MILYLKLQKAKQESLPVEKINKVVFDCQVIILGEENMFLHLFQLYQRKLSKNIAK